MPTLELKNVCYAYEKGKAVLSNINAELETGKLYAILGPSGSGRTTLLALLGRLDTPTQGNARFDGENIGTNGLEHHRENHSGLEREGKGMKKITIILACMLSCFILFTGCTDQKGNDDQESNVNSGVEVDINDETNSTEEPASSAPPPDDFTYNPKSPENSDGIVVRPKE